MNDDRRGKLVAVAIALLLPLTIDEGVGMVGRNMAPRVQFYTTVVCGAVAVAVGMKAAAPVLASGLFFGGILTIVRNYYYNWGHLDDMTRLLTLLAALSLMVWLTMRGGRKGSAAAKRRNAPRKRR